ncbi:tryptophan dimethylallyltransferase family protein [Gandjariella thermophila]|uniref:tryptophan dimethylallyltransferase family protein n=1 Tax=Gandjariella thermophila TaxID=1931992 RepID=UPI0010F61B35|nr:tryptophan dimethylallyltransferase family protein [Gandjariella thermophila]
MAGPDVERVAVDIRDVLSPWGSRPIGTTAGPAPSFVSADGFPAEMSLSWRGINPEIRLLWESLGSEPTARSNQEAGQALTRRLADKPGVSISRYLRVEDLFVTPNPATYRPTVWHALAWRPGNHPQRLEYKVYLNPQVHGVEHAPEVIGEAMRRLDLSVPWRSVGRRVRELAERGHEIEFFALDLADATSKPRVKVYFRHDEMPAAELDTVAALARRHDSGRAERARRIVYGDTRTITNEPMTCLAFRHGTPAPEEANLYLRLPDNTRSDAEARDRVTRLMRVEGIDPGPYQRCLDLLAPAPLANTTGLQELLSYRTIDRGPADLGLYLRFSTYDHEATVGEARGDDVTEQHHR